MSFETSNSRYEINKTGLIIIFGITIYGGIIPFFILPLSSRRNTSWITRNSGENLVLVLPLSPGRTQDRNNTGPDYHKQRG